MQADHAFTIGRSHKVCEDYARSHDMVSYSGDGVRHMSYAFVSDGCSGSRDSDVGARVLIASAEQFLLRRRGILDANDIRHIVVDASATQRLLGMPEEMLDATLLGVYVDSRINVFGMGDGMIAFRMHSGDLAVFDFVSPSGFPVYPSYFLSQSRFIAVQQKMSKDSENGWRVDYIREDGDTIERDERCFWSRNLELFRQDYSRGDRDGVRDLTTDGECVGDVDEDDFIETVAVFSDGVKSFVDQDRKSVPWMAVVGELMTFKGHKGEFVKRRLQGFLRACARRGWQHDDDLSMGAVYLG